jgi:hypothetical protein
VKASHASFVTKVPGQPLNARFRLISHTALNLNNSTIMASIDDAITDLKSPEKLNIIQTAKSSQRCEI